MKYLHGGDIYTYEGMLDFSANINPFGPSQRVMDAVSSSAGKIGSYPDSRCRQLRKALSVNEGIPQEMFVFGNGAADLIFSIVFAMHPKKAVLTAPSFSEYAQALSAARCQVLYHYLEETEDFRLGIDYLEKLTTDVDIAFLCSPNNPTGQTIEQGLLTEIVNKCKKNEIRLILDECFFEFLENPEEVLSGKDILKKPWVFLLRAFTKMYAMPGLRLGYGMCSDSGFLEKLEASKQPWSVSVPAQEAGLVGLKEQERVDQTRCFISEERKMMEKELGRIGVRYFPSSANYMLLKSEYDLFERLKSKNILIRDCCNYEGLGKGFYRIAIKSSWENKHLLRELKEIYSYGPDGTVEVKCPLAGKEK